MDEVVLKYWSIPYGIEKCLDNGAKNYTYFKRNLFLKIVRFLYMVMKYRTWEMFRVMIRDFNDN